MSDRLKTVAAVVVSAAVLVYASTHPTGTRPTHLSAYAWVPTSGPIGWAVDVSETLLFVLMVVAVFAWVYEKITP